MYNLSLNGNKVFTSRAAARMEKRHDEKIVGPKCFCNGSFGLYARQNSHGEYIDGPNPMINVWTIVKK